MEINTDTKNETRNDTKNDTDTDSGTKNGTDSKNSTNITKNSTDTNTDTEIKIDWLYVVCLKAVDTINIIIVSKAHVKKYFANCKKTLTD